MPIYKLSQVLCNLFELLKMDLCDAFGVMGPRPIPAVRVHFCAETHCDGVLPICPKPSSDAAGPHRELTAPLDAAGRVLSNSAPNQSNEVATKQSHTQTKPAEETE